MTPHIASNISPVSSFVLASHFTVYSEFVDCVTSQVANEVIGEMNLSPEDVFLAQGTLRPDLIESASHLASGKAEVIKTHHNDTELIRKLRDEVYAHTIDHLISGPRLPVLYAGRPFRSDKFQRLNGKLNGSQKMSFGLYFSKGLTTVVLQTVLSVASKLC